MSDSPTSITFHPVVALPPGFKVFNFSSRLSDEEVAAHVYGVGRYDEKRVGTYTTPLFSGGRDVHMGIDLFAPAGTSVHAFDEGVFYAMGYNSAEGDYGYTLITQHILSERPLYVLHGHLSKKSMQRKAVGQPFDRGEIIAWIGDRSENGNWVPHLHFQLSYEKPVTHDMPGVVSDAERTAALLKYPDPRIVLGPLY